MWWWDESFDQEDVVTLDNFADVPEAHVIKFLLPPGEHRGSKRCRCCRKDTFVGFYSLQQFNERYAHQKGGTNYEAFCPSPLVGMDLLEYDVDFVLRLLDDADAASPLELDVSSIGRFAAKDVLNPLNGQRDFRQEVEAHIYYVLGGEIEKAQWRRFDEMMVSLSGGRCSLGHELSCVETRRPWICDLCERSFTCKAQPHRCLFPTCDFDLCGDCSISCGSHASDVDPTLLKQFQDFLAVQAFKLPRSPPRDKRRETNDGPVRRVASSRVAKWNAMPLDTKTAVSLRQMFLSALGVEETSPRWAMFQPGGVLRCQVVAELPSLCEDNRKMALAAFYAELSLLVFFAGVSGAARDMARPSGELFQLWFSVVKGVE
mmetsp:Transcript_12609/g.34893  ORF Transcript_12609/g.34893 Transcript_12609/m.34893 type:complete len:374 (-) Transcript_12609:14-1135(-)